MTLYVMPMISYKWAYDSKDQKAIIRINSTSSHQWSSQDLIFISKLPTGRKSSSFNQLNASKFSKRHASQYNKYRSYLWQIFRSTMSFGFSPTGKLKVRDMWLMGCPNPYKLQQSWERIFLKVFNHAKTK